MLRGICSALALASLCLLGPPTLVSHAARLAANAEALGRCVGECNFVGVSTQASTARSLTQSDVDRALWKASKNGNATGAEEALEAGADVNAKFGPDGRNPLLAAAESGHMEVVELLIKAGSDVDEGSESGITPVAMASEKGDLDVLLALLRAGASPHKAVDFEQLQGNPRFKNSEARKRYELERALVNAGLEVEGATQPGAIPLMVAADFRHAHIVEALLSWGAHVNRTNEYGESPLHYIFLDPLPGRNETPNAAAVVTRMLAEAGANVNAASHAGITPLFRAVVTGEHAAMKVLIEAGADLDVAESSGETALWVAAFHGDLKAVRILVKAGADVSVADNHGRTPLSVVCRCEKHGKTKKSNCAVGGCETEEDKKALEALLLG